MKGKIFLLADVAPCIAVPLDELIPGETGTFNVVVFSPEEAYVSINGSRDCDGIRNLSESQDPEFVEMVGKVLMQATNVLGGSDE